MELIRKLEGLPEAEQVATAQEMLREVYRASLFKTARYLLGYREVNWATHGDMIHALQDSEPRKLIVMPRGTFKSSLSSVAYPIWCLLRNPNERILIDSEIYTNSKNFLREISLHLRSEKLVSLFGNFEGTVWNEGELIIAQRTKVLKEASITASGIGSEKTSQHFDRIIMDDLNSASNSGTPELREKVIKHYQYNTAILEPRGTMVLVGTRYAANDAIGFVITNEIGAN